MANVSIADMQKIEAICKVWIMKLVKTCVRDLITNNVLGIRSGISDKFAYSKG